jgi:tRNA 5-methylaminomethyl-2-thiouridine biosynthesis bifunctional protein
MKDPIDWRNDKTPISTHFDDIYFDVENGLAESQYVFVATNQIEEKSSSSLVVGEFGFGTGLNFFATAQEFLSHRSNSQLFYFSCEKFPLSPESIRKALSAWPQLKSLVDEFLQYYFRLPKGFSTIQLAGGRIRLSIFFGEATEFAKNLNAIVDVWYFDGFAPKKNPEMWSQDLCQLVAKLSHSKSSFSSFSSAGFFRRQLKSVGAVVFKKRGFGRKREMSYGHFEALPPKQARTVPQKIAIVGAGMVGTQIASRLNFRGLDYHCFDVAPQAAHGASGNPLALVMPYLMSKNSERIFFSSSAFGFQRSAYSSAFFHPSGVRHHFFPKEKTLQLSSNLHEFFWPEEFCEVHSDQVFFQTAGVLESKKYIESFWNQDPPRLHLSQKISKIENHGDTMRLRDETGQLLGEFDHVFLACAYDVIDFMPSLKPLLKRTRGQIAYLEDFFDVPSAVSFGHYLSPKVNHLQVFGGTYRHHQLEDGLKRDDFEELENSFHQFFGKKIHLSKGRASIRCHSQSNWPLLYSHGGISCLSGLGSRAFSESGLCAESLVSYVFNEPSPLTTTWERFLLKQTEK